MPSFRRAARHRPAAQRSFHEEARVAAELARTQACLQAARVNLRHLR